MSIEAIVGSVAICIPFILFAVVLYWGELQTRSLSQ
jgi:F0F1-type ATP synthase assembly protein I